MTFWRPGTVRNLSTKLVSFVPADTLADLRSEDPRAAVEVHFAPIGLRKLPSADFTSSDCSVDGFYDALIDEQMPWIFYSDAVVDSRVRFTIIHELGHHLLVHDAVELLDDLDRIGGSPGRASQLEEAVCHQFAGDVLIPNEVLVQVVGAQSLRPQHIIDLSDETGASWEAIAVRAANWADQNVAVVLVRQQGEVAFVAAPRFSRWQRGSAVQPGGPLDRALRSNSTARPEVFRYGLGYSESLFCDTRQVDQNLAVAVMSQHTSDRHFEILEQPEPSWKDREEFCQWCGNERNVDWCQMCSGRRCHSCDRCGCGAPRQNPLCPECSYQNAFAKGSRVCVDCEADGLT